MSEEIRFLLNGKPKTVTDISPTTTVLDYLRNTEHLTGTKEGCAEGDCGACTVVIGEVINNKIKYSAVNSCIIFMPKLHGKMLLTVEGIKGKNGEMHPVQKALLDMHGSQCGFCTPGFVMSLFALFHKNCEGIETDEEIHQALAGNLCRCTGYRPIVDAAKAIMGQRNDWFTENEKELIEQLEELNKEDSCNLAINDQKFFSPTSMDQLIELFSVYPTAQLIAGGTDVGLLVTKMNQRIETLISVSDVWELRTVIETDEFLELGAAVTYSEALPAIEKISPEFASMIKRIGSTQIRNMGTMGGNIANASPIGDSAPCLIALGAKLSLCSSEGFREIPIEEFFTGYRETALDNGEFIGAIRIPRPKEEQIFKAYKITKRFDQDISAVSAAFRLSRENGKVKDIRIGYGGVSATPKRAYTCENFLKGKEWNENTVNEAARKLSEDFTPLSDFRASADYRATVAGNLLGRFFIETTSSAVTEVWKL